MDYFCQFCDLSLWETRFSILVLFPTLLAKIPLIIQLRTPALIMSLNPLSPNIHIQFHQTDLYYFLKE